MHNVQAVTYILSSVSTVLDMRNGAVLFEVDVESLGLEVFGHHHARLDNPRLLWEIPLAEALDDSAGQYILLGADE